MGLLADGTQSKKELIAAAKRRDELSVRCQTYNDDDIIDLRDDLEEDSDLPWDYASPFLFQTWALTKRFFYATAAHSWTWNSLVTTVCVSVILGCCLFQLEPKTSNLQNFDSYVGRCALALPSTTKKFVHSLVVYERGILGR